MNDRALFRDLSAAILSDVLDNGPTDRLAPWGELLCVAHGACLRKPSGSMRRGSITR